MTKSPDGDSNFLAKVYFSFFETASSGKFYFWPSPEYVENP
jgi:hypothetical protein